MATLRRHAVSSDSDGAVDIRAVQAVLCNGTPVVTRTLVDRSLRFARPADDPVRQYFQFNVSAGSFFLSQYGHSGIGIPLACPGTDVDIDLKKALSVWGQKHTFRDIVKIVHFGEEEELRTVLEFTRSIGHSSWKYGQPNPWEIGSDSLTGNLQSLQLGQQQSHDACPTQRGFTSLLRLVCEQSKTFLSNMSVLARAAGQLPGLDDSAITFVLNDLQQLERNLAVAQESAGLVRPAMQRAPAREFATEHMTYSRLGSSSPPQVESDGEFTTSSLSGQFGLANGSPSESRRIVDLAQHAASLSLSSSDMSIATLSTHEHQIVGHAETSQWYDEEELASSPPPSSFGGSVDNIEQLLAKQCRGAVIDAVEAAPTTATPTCLVADSKTSPTVDAIDDPMEVSEPSDFQNSRVTFSSPEPPSFFSHSLNMGSGPSAAYSTSPALPSSSPEVPAVQVTAQSIEMMDAHPTLTSGTFGESDKVSWLLSEALPRAGSSVKVDVAHKSRLPRPSSSRKTLPRVSSPKKALPRVSAADKSPRKGRPLDHKDKKVGGIGDSHKKATKSKLLDVRKTANVKKVGQVTHSTHEPDQRPEPVVLATASIPASHGAVRSGDGIARFREVMVEDRYPQMPVPPVAEPDIDIDVDSDAADIIVEKRLAASRLPIRVSIVRGAESDPRARLSPLNRKAMVVDGSALEIAEATFAKVGTRSRVITGHTRVSAALDEMAKAHNTTIGTPASTPSASAHPLTANIVNTESPDIFEGLSPKNIENRKRAMAAAQAMMQQEASSEATENEPVAKKPRVQSEKCPAPRQPGSKKVEASASRARASKIDNSRRRSVAKTETLPSSSRSRPRSDVGP